LAYFLIGITTNGLNEPPVVSPLCIDFTAVNSAFSSHTLAGVEVLQLLNDTNKANTKHETKK
jgi:hypothetical protein